ncbi:MAG: class I SAM-dependent DNA methyltransferase [Limnochordia bacterium]|jgi:SAM-dependent methyltransferase
MKSAYSVLSAYYDGLIGVDYDLWLSYIQRVLAEYGLDKPGQVLDLACGTGEMTLRLARLGWDVTGVDVSIDMLAMAENKLRAQGLSAAFLHQDMRFLATPGSFDLVLCCCDALNYLLSPWQLQRTFQRVRSCLRPGGLFIFDLNTPYKLAHVYGNSSFGINFDDYSLIMECDYNDDQVCHIELTFFLPQGGLYRKITEDHYQRAYSQGEVLDLLRQTGWQPLHQHADYSFQRPGERTERMVFVNTH